MEKNREAKEAYYNWSVKLLELMRSKGYLTQEECRKIDVLNRQIFSPELSEMYQ